MYRLAYSYIHVYVCEDALTAVDPRQGLVTRGGSGGGGSEATFDKLFELKSQPEDLSIKRTYRMEMSHSA